MKSVILLSGSLTINGATTWMLTLHEAMIKKRLNVIHVVTSVDMRIFPKIGNTFYTGRARSFWLLRIFRLIQLHKLFPDYFFYLEDLVFNRRIKAILSQRSLSEHDFVVIKDFSSYTPSFFKNKKVISVIHHLLTGSEGFFHTPERFFFSKLIAVSESSAAMARHTGLFVDRVIYNPLDVDKIKHLAACESEKLNWPYIVFVGGLKKNKGVFELIDAFAHIKNNPDLGLVFVGDGSESKSLKKRVTELNLNHRISFLGMQKNPFPYLKKAHALVLPSYSEAIGYVALEAAALSIPCVLSGFASAYEFFEDEAIVPLNTDYAQYIKQLSERIELFIQHPKLYLKADLLKKMKPESIVDQYMAI